MKKLVLIDSNALVHRAFHALPPTLTSPKGVLTNAVYGFTSVLLKMLKDLKPDYVVATYDLSGPTFRHEEFAEYKIHREKAPDELYAQIPLTKSILGAFGIPVFEKQGFEADDLIGSLATEAKKEKDLQVVIVTGDLDTLQLVDGNKVVVFTLRKGLTDTILYDEKEVNNRYGIKPEQVIDFKGLKGDPSDNIPGVPGVGDKTASALVQEFGSMENLYEKISNLKSQISKSKKSPLSEKLIEKLIENKDQAFFSKKLATIICNVDIDFSLDKSDWKNNMSRQEIEKLFREFGFFSLVKRLDELDINGELPGSPSTSFGASQASLLAVEQAITEGKSLKIFKSKNDIKKDLDKLAGLNEFLFDVQGGLFIHTVDGKDCFGFNRDALGGAKSGADPLWKVFVSVFENEKILKSGHDLKPLLKEFIKKGVHPKGISFDTKIAAYLIKADRKDYDLPVMYSNELGQNLSEGLENRLAGILKLKNLFWEKMKTDKLIDVFEKIEMPLVGVLAEVELVGIKIDTGSLDKLSRLVNEELLKLEKDIYKHAGTQFNINSPQQLKEILFERLNLKGKVRKTAKGALSTAASELDKLVGEHPIVEFILKYRELQKLKTTYIEPFPHLIDKKTGRLHTTLNQTGTVTGRLSSQDPNLQNIPIKTELGQEFRRAFISSPEYKLVSFDYSQLELRIVAHVSGDKKMIEVFRRGEDIHTRTAAEIFNVEPGDVTSSMRREAKALNFGLIYGMGVMGFQRSAGVSREKAREFIDRYMSEFNGVARYMESMRIRANKEGFVETIFGRRRYLPEIKTGIPQLVAQAERMAINMPIQGTEGDFLRMAMNRIHNLIHTKYNDNDVRMLLQVHDELLFEIKNSMVESVSPEIKKIMENVYHLEVPLVVDVKYGDNWRDLESF